VTQAGVRSVDQLSYGVNALSPAVCNARKAKRLASATLKICELVGLVADSVIFLHLRRSLAQSRRRALHSNYIYRDSAGQRGDFGFNQLKPHPAGSLRIGTKFAVPPGRSRFPADLRSPRRHDRRKGRAFRADSPLVAGCRPAARRAYP
jgi:hypothetical protein